MGEKRPSGSKRCIISRRKRGEEEGRLGMMLQGKVGEKAQGRVSSQI